MKTLPILLSALFGAIAAAPANAGTTSFRCQNDLVNVGDAKSSVQMKCGLPVLKIRSASRRRAKQRRGRRAVPGW